MMKTFAATILLALVTNQAVAATDIAGVQIGSPLAPQRAIIAKASPSYQLNDIKLTSGKTVGINAIAQKMAGLSTNLSPFKMNQASSGLWREPRRLKKVRA